MKKIILSAGGTGGHVFPMVALYEGLKKEHQEIMLITDIRVEKYINNLNIKFQLVDAVSPFGKKYFIYGIFTISKIIKSIFQSYKILKKFKPDLVIGCGGYVSFSVLIASKLLGIKIILYETNSVLGRVNKIFSKYSSKIITGYKDPIKLNKKYINKTFYVGQLIRKNILSTDIGLKKIQQDKINLLVLGGSQGANIFSKLLPKILKKLLVKDISIHVFHQSNNKDVNNITEEYKKIQNMKNFSFDVFNFEPNIQKYYQLSNLVICRSGSSTLSELCAIQLPFIAIPLPSSLDNHQYFNAKFYVDHECGWLIKQDSDLEYNLYSKLNYIFQNYNEEISQKAKNFETIIKKNTLENFLKLIN
tara:strand:- start:599 stop:1681 length:1083 start_codon:yes stop_codon:yes gene_type:complete